MGNAWSQSSPGEYCDRLIQRRPELRDILAENVGQAGPSDYQRLIWREYMRQAPHGSTHVHRAYAAIDQNYPGGSLWRVWARMYLPFMAPYPDVMTHKLAQNCFEELGYNEHDRWDPNLKCKATMSRVNFSFSQAGSAASGQKVFISVLGVDGSNDNQSVFQAPSGIWNHVTSGGQSVWLLDPDQRNGPYWVTDWETEETESADDLWKIGDVHGMIEERRWIR